MILPGIQPSKHHPDIDCGSVLHDTRLHWDLSEHMHCTTILPSGNEHSYLQKKAPVQAEK